MMSSVVLQKEHGTALVAKIASAPKDDNSMRDHVSKCSNQRQHTL